MDRRTAYDSPLSAALGNTRIKMIENEQLMAFAENEDDVPVAFCICKNGAYIDWKDSPPEEVLYVPENTFEKIAPSFMERLGRDYYGSNGISGELEDILVSEILLVSKSANLQQVKVAIYQFIQKASSVSATHYLVFEGP